MRDLDSVSLGDPLGNAAELSIRRLWPVHTSVRNGAMECRLDQYVSLWRARYRRHAWARGAARRTDRPAGAFRGRLSHDFSLPAVDLVHSYRPHLAMGAEPDDRHPKLCARARLERLRLRLDRPTGPGDLHAGIRRGLAPNGPDHGDHARRSARDRPRHLASHQGGGDPALAGVSEDRIADAAAATGDLHRADRDRRGVELRSRRGDDRRRSRLRLRSTGQVRRRLCLRARQYRPGVGRGGGDARLRSDGAGALSLPRAVAEEPVSGAGAPVRIGRLGLYAFLVGMALFFAIPLLIVISTSLKSLDEIRDFSIFVP